MVRGNRLCGVALASKQYRANVEEVTYFELTIIGTSDFPFVIDNMALLLQPTSTRSLNLSGTISGLDRSHRSFEAPIPEAGSR